MTTYEYETSEFAFSWTNDRAVLIKCMGYFTGNPKVVEEPFDMIYPKITQYKLDNKTIGIKIHDFEEVMKSHASGLVLQTVLTCFRDTFVKLGSQREQLISGLTYYGLAVQYKLLVPQDVAKVKLEALHKDYNNMLDKLPEHDKALMDFESKARTYHISEPLVASTGFMAYPTRDYTWLITETLIKNEETPEYINVVDIRNNMLDAELAYIRGSGVAVFRGLQVKCIEFVMKTQEAVYGVSFKSLIDKRNENELVRKMISELETILKIPKEETLQYKEEYAVRKALEEEESKALEADLRQLNFKQSKVNTNLATKGD